MIAFYHKFELLTIFSFLFETIQAHSASGVVSASIFPHLVSLLKREFCSKYKHHDIFFSGTKRVFFSNSVGSM